MDALEKDLVNLDSRLGVAATTLGDQPLLFSHPVYQYLISRYNLNAVELHWEPDEVPDAGAWNHLDELLEAHPAKWMLWEGKPLDMTVRGLEDRGISSAVFDPCGNRPAEGDYLTVMAANAAVLEGIAR
jgi:zinc transport system substrate-binding protein